MVKQRRRPGTTRVPKAAAKSGPWLAANPVHLAQAALIALASLWIYWPALNGGLIWDDRWYITINPLLHDWSGLAKFWFSPGSWIEFYPIHETVLWVLYQLEGENPLGYHLVSLGLHIVSALLVWRLLDRFGLRLAWLGGLLFAINPTQVPSVAWIAELKNTVSQPLALLTMIAWIDFDESRRQRDYRRAILYFVLAMLCKITMAPFPFVLVLYAWWKRGRCGVDDLKRIAPFFILSLSLVAVTTAASIIYEAHIHPQALVIPLGSPLTRLVRAGVLWWFYLGATLFPVHLRPIYPMWDIPAASAAAWAPLLALLVLGAWCWGRRRTWGRHVLLGLGFFGLNILPFLGFNAISYMMWMWVEIQLLYLPVVGVIGLVVAVVEDLGRKLPAPVRFAPIGATAVAAVAFIWGARSFVGWYAGEETFWNRTLQRVPSAWIAYDDLGVYMISEERYPEAIALLRRSIELLPGYDFGYLNLAIAMEKNGNTGEALTLYRKAISLNPQNETAYLDIGEVLRKQGRLDLAGQTFSTGLEFVPDSTKLAGELASLLLQTGQIPEALALYEQAVKLNPHSAQLQYNYGSALLKSGAISQAEEHFARAVEIDPKLAPAHENLGGVLARMGRLPESIDESQAALDIDPTLQLARNNLARALAQTGRIQDAIWQFQKELEYHPGDAQARQNLARLQQYQQQHAPAGGGN